MSQQHTLVPVTNGKADPFLLSPPLAEQVEKAGFGPYLNPKVLLDLHAIYVDPEVHPENITIDSTNLRLDNILVALTTTDATTLYQFNASRYSHGRFCQGHTFGDRKREIAFMVSRMSVRVLEHVDGPVLPPDFTFSLSVNAEYYASEEKVVVKQNGFTSNSPDHIGEVVGINFVVPAFEATKKQSFTYK